MKNVGVWIDHHKAVIVIIENESEKTQEMLSNVKKTPIFKRNTFNSFKRYARIDRRGCVEPAAWEPV